MSDAPHAVTYRAMTEADVPVAQYVKKNAADALTRSEGREPSGWVPNSGNYLAHLVRTDPEGSWVAESRGLVAGYAQGFVRGDIWFLAQLFVQPELQASGTGKELLRRSREYGERRNARIFSVVSSTSPAAQSLYMRSGMFPRGAGYNMAGEIEPLRALPGPAGNRKIIVDCGGWQDRMAEMDRQLLGAERRIDHALYLSGEGILGAHASFGLTRDGDFAGYGYVEEDGWIAPIAAWEPQDQLPLLRMAADWLAGHEVSKGRMWVLSLNDTMMSALLAAGWRIDGWTFLMSSEPFAKFDRYHPSGGLLL